MRSERFVITDRSWAIIEPLLPGSIRDRGRTAKDNRLFLEAVLWKVRVGSPWRDLPPGFGEWNSVFRRFRRWTQRGVFHLLKTCGNHIDNTDISSHILEIGARGTLRSCSG